MRKVAGITFSKVKNDRLTPFAIHIAVLEKRTIFSFHLLNQLTQLLIRKFQYFNLYDNSRNSSPFIPNNVTEKYQ
jgi:hypothetical protein